ncbi:MAG: fumarylacetoacetate hydrolase family protein [Eubacteriaceae bacterium]|nr:fumarylacetoacetate hydrolase family protein [Eubacteriaceae bacterium]
MKYVTFNDGNGHVVGALSKDGAVVYPLAQLGFDFKTMVELIEGYSPEVEKDIEAKLERAANGLSIDAATLAAPIPQPAHDIICLGSNYVAHAKEGPSYRGRENEYVLPEKATYFTKRVNPAVAHGESVPAHVDITSSLDYEAELAVVIGKRADHVSKEDAYNYIFGYTILNDVTAREIQRGHGGQYFFGKSLDGFTPMGPCIATISEFSSPPDLDIKCRVNGELRQDSNTRDLIFDIAHVISDLSQGIALDPGDIIATGTPSGVGMGFTPPKFLNVGDIVECEIEGIGILANPIV